MIGPETFFLVAVRENSEGQAIRRGLESLGVSRIMEAREGPAALKILQSGPEFFVIASWELPLLGGLRLVKSLRASPLTADWPCILVVPEHHESETNMAFGLRVEGFLPRPIRREKIVAKVQAVLEGADRPVWPLKDQGRGDDLMDAGRYAEAVQTYTQSIDLGRKRLAGLNLEIGALLLDQGRNREAADFLEKAALSFHRLALAQTQLGKAYRSMGRHREAVRALKRAVDLDPDNDEILRLFADSLLEIDQNRTAGELFVQLLKRTPGDPFLVNRLGIALRKQKRYDDAVRHYKKAIEAQNRDEHLFFNLGRCYHEMGRNREAVLAMNQALNLNPNFQEARRLLIKWDIR